jgi:hypothetical protein
VLVTRVDAATNAVSGQVPVGNGGGGLAVVDDALWASAFTERRVWRIIP